MTDRLRAIICVTLSHYALSLNCDLQTTVVLLTSYLAIKYFIIYIFIIKIVHHLLVSNLLVYGSVREKKV